MNRDATPAPAGEFDLSAAHLGAEWVRFWSESGDEGMALEEEGVILDANRAMAAMFGCELRAFIGRHIHEFTTSQSRAAIRRHFQAGNEKPIEAFGLRRNGSVFPIELLGRSIFHEGRRLRLTVVRDITERKKAEEALRLQSAALEAAANGIVITDNKGNIAWVNPAFTALTGYTAEEILGRNIRLLRSGEHPNSFYASMWQAIMAGRTWRSEVTNRRKDGSTFIQEQTITPVRNEQGEITHFIAIQLDITERKRMEAELSESQQRFRHIFQFNPGAIALQAIEDHRFLDVNEGFLRPLGYTREEVIGKTPLELGVYADPKDRSRVMQRLREEGHLRNYEIRCRSKDGQLFDVLLSAEPIQLGAERCLLTIVNDINRWKQQQAELEERLRRSQKLESIGTLAGGVAHDFNNLLTVIRGHTGLLLADAALPASCRESLQEIAEAASRATNLTRQLLTFSRKHPIQRRPVDLNDVVGNLTRMLRRLIGEDIALEIRCAPRLGSVLADVGLLEQVLMNLTVNARDAIHARHQAVPAGRIVVSTENVMAQSPALKEEDDRPLTEHVCLSVTDNGCGIPPEIRERIFDPFFTTKEVGKGTGLGLSTVHGIVTEHGGMVDFESRVGEGTCFRIYLQSVPRTSSTAAPPAAQPVRGGTETILLVEDEDALRNLAKEVLERKGYRVMSAEHAQAALALWKDHHEQVDLLLTDVVMPGAMNGIRLAELLQASKAGLKIIYTSGYATEVAGVELNPATGVHYLPKPYPPEELAQIVRDCLDASGNKTGSRSMAAHHESDSHRPS